MKHARILGLAVIVLLPFAMASLACGTTHSPGRGQDGGAAAPGTSASGTAPGGDGTAAPQSPDTTMPPPGTPTDPRPGDPANGGFDAAPPPAIGCVDLTGHWVGTGTSSTNPTQMSTFELVVTNQAGDMADVAILIQNPSAGGAGSMCAPGPLAFTVQARLFASGGGACELNGKSAASGAQGGFVGLSVINGSMTGKVLVMCSTGEYQVTLTKK